MNYIFVPNAIVLILLGLYTWRQNPGRLSQWYLVTNVAVAIWALCFLALHELQAVIPINPVSQVQLVTALVFANGFYYTSVLYPNPESMPGRIINAINALVMLTFTVLVLFTDYVSRAVLEEGVVVFVDGAGYLFYSLYLVLLGTLTIVNLVRSYRRYPEYRIRVAYMLTGLGLFILMAIIFDLVLVLMGNYELLVVGHLGSVFPSLFFAYAITKHDLLDIKLVVQRNTAKIIVALLVVTTLVLAFELSLISRPWSLLFICLTGVFWAFVAGPLEVKLVTTARRKFVRNWYDPEGILNRLAGKLELEKNRRDIFRKLIEELDDTFELERAHSIVAVRGDDDRLICYELLGGAEHNLQSELSVDDEFMEECRNRTGPTELTTFSAGTLQRFAALGHTDPEKSLVVPFFSPEILEGVLVLGERSNQDAFSQKDRQFLMRLVSYVSAILYRLTPFEKLEKLYFENQRRLHEAEIQLVRGEKTRAIAHATRQAHHEIRTPLNIIRLGARRIKDMESAEKYKEIIEAQIERAMEIVEETLAITDAEGGEEDRYQSVDINQVVTRCLRLLPESMHERVLVLQEDLHVVQGIPSEMQVLFSNLLKNAVEAMPERGTLTVRTFEERGEIVVTIGDTGNGIAPELREKIWEPYFSGKVTAAGNMTAGRGWGLTICNRIVTEHKGTIQFTSDTGKGTTFTVRLPYQLLA
ncbi:MAG: ATP-binding protein [Gammaproteobacteria bacterium]|nr:ATP-binding protein [Gammaproteobacteria bacterium]MDP2141062.1 ATP-binding protein [Gammaproteobacteria bacterium]MDP2348520.1 ATP-binding protein [Gammaproteobacteria bacterium]